jgi:hypothetical protein
MTTILTSRSTTTSSTHSSASAHHTTTEAAASLPRLLLFLVLTGNFFVDNGKESSRSLFRIVDLDERMSMRFSCLTLSAVIEVLQNCALEARTDNGADTTTVAFDSLVYRLSEILNFLRGLGLFLNLRLSLLFDDGLDQLLGVLLHRMLDELTKGFLILLVVSRLTDSNCSMHDWFLFIIRGV